MLVIPAIDLINGKCVRLTEGKFDQKKEYNSNPLEQAEEFKHLGAERIHIVDLDGAATGKSINRKLIKEIKKSTGLAVQTGGGIRTMEDVEELVAAGIDHIILGTILVENFELVKKMLAKYQKHLIAGVDARDNIVKVRGWKDGEGVDALQLGKELFQAGFKTAVYTDIAKDGKLQGPNISATKEFMTTGLNCILSGGISSLQDIIDAAKLGTDGLEGIIVGKAYYEGKVDLKAAFNAVKEA